MYLTIYKTINQKANVNYLNLMSTEITPTNIFKHTIFIEHPTARENLTENTQKRVLNTEDAITKAYGKLLPFAENYEEQYYEFKIPKRSGGLRTINAPNPAFKTALADVKEIFEKDIQCLAHTAAYAYTKHRSILDAIKKHQANNSNWYLKLDLTNFFPSCNPDFICSQLKEIFPFYYISENSWEKLKQIIRICCLHNGLPQGTPMSPLLTNLLMVPFDYQIERYLMRGTGEHFVYTRYADDLLISCKSNFDWRALTTKLKEILNPFEVKNEKTRYGSKAGSNWNLGLMLNKDNNITLGYQKKRQLNAMVNNFLTSTLINHQRWSTEDIRVLQGQLSWLKHIEPEYHEHLLNKYANKYNIADVEDFIHHYL